MLFGHVMDLIDPWKIQAHNWTMHQSFLCPLVIIFWICKNTNTSIQISLYKSKYMLFQTISNNCLLPTTKMAFFPHGFVKNSPWTKYLSICKISGPFWESAVSCILPSISFTLPKFNVAPEKSPSNKESSFSAIKCQGRAFKLPVCISKPTASQQTQLFHPQPSNLFKDIQPDFICLVGYPTVFLSLPTACDRGTTRWRSPTAPEKKQLWKMIFLFKRVIFRFHVNFPGAIPSEIWCFTSSHLHFRGCFYTHCKCFFCVKIWTTHHSGGDVYFEQKDDSTENSTTLGTSRLGIFSNHTSKSSSSADWVHKKNITGASKCGGEDFWGYLRAKVDMSVLT